MAPSCKMRLSRFSAKLEFQERAECGNIDTNVGNINNNILVLAQNIVETNYWSTQFLGLWVILRLLLKFSRNVDTISNKALIMPISSWRFLLNLLLIFNNFFDPKISFPTETSVLHNIFRKETALEAHKCLPFWSGIDI